MHVTPMSLQPPRLSHFVSHWISAFAVAVLLALMAVVAHAAAPPAGTSISNQASASYTDGSNVPRSVTSNVVQTTVAQIASVTLASSGTQNGTPGSVVYYPHTLTNTGNGTDTFNLTAVSGTAGFTMTNVLIYADNGSGQPTGPAITSTGALALGSTFKFIVVGTVPTTVTSGQTNVITVTGTSGLDATKKDTNTDTTTVTSNAVVTLTKAASVSSVPAGTGSTITYTLTYTNTGNSTATAVALTDVLPAGLNYTAGTARWSVTGATTVLSDTGASSGTSPNTITSGYTSGTKTLLFTLAQVTAGQSGTISFNATVAAGTAPGVINNTATSSYNNGSTTATGTSNTVPVTVQQTAAVTMTSPPANPGPAAPGSTVGFSNRVTNNGNGVDTFNIVITTSDYPTGTTFQLFKSDGLTPLVDTNGDGIVDTGPVNANEYYDVVLKATLPPNAPSGGPYSVTKTGTSVVDPTKTSSSVDTLTLVAGAKVDLTNNTVLGVGVPGNGPGPEGSPVLTQTTNPGTTSIFILVANNTGASPDNYNLAASTLSTFASPSLPSGWTVSFKADGGGRSCATTGATITNTGPVAAADAAVVCAVVTVPAGSPAATTQLYFRVLSPTSSSTDIVHDALTVNAVRSITITPNGTGQTYPGGSYVYSHTVTNTGNVVEGNGGATPVSTVTLTTVNNQSGWTSTLYLDLNNDSLLDAADPLISGDLSAVIAGLNPGQSVRVFNKVISPSGALLGAVNATSVTVTTTNGTYTAAVPPASVATDSTTVIAGNLTLVKNQALDTACAGPVGGTVYSSASLSAKPGECVLYRIVVTNVGSVNATSVVVTDSVPSYTTLSALAATSAGSIASGAPAVGGTGTISANVGTLAAGAAAAVTFGVKVAN
ncbi:MAG: hypothetical protein ABIV07_09900 [Polaromonas sp.]